MPVDFVDQELCVKVLFFETFLSPTLHLLTTYIKKKIIIKICMSNTQTHTHAFFSMATTEADDHFSLKLCVQTV